MLKPHQDTTSSEEILHILKGIDQMQTHLADGAKISQQDGLWHLFAKSGDGVAAGDCLRSLLINLAKQS
jgi:hypothetical protein